MNIPISLSNMDTEEGIKVVPNSRVGVLFKPEYPQSMTPFKKLDVFPHASMFMGLLQESICR